MAEKILFVCTGNTCRSPLCMAIYNKYAKGDKTAFSRGLNVYDAPASSYMIEVLKENENIDISDHMAKAISEEDIKDAALIVALEKSHKNYIEMWQPQYIEKVITLKEDGDVSDPFGGNKEVYINCYNEIKELILNLIEREG